MSTPSVLNPHPPEFDRFLHAWVGEDRNGQAVTVLSTLARLGLDPWTETAELVTLGREAAQARLEKLLGRFKDVPALSSDRGRVARDLSRLLPDRPLSDPLERVVWTVADRRAGAGGAIWTVLALIFVLVQMFMLGGSIPGP